MRTAQYKNGTVTCITTVVIPMDVKVEEKDGVQTRTFTNPLLKHQFIFSGDTGYPEDHRVHLEDTLISNTGKTQEYTGTVLIETNTVEHADVYGFWNKLRAEHVQYWETTERVQAQRDEQNRLAPIEDDDVLRTELEFMLGDDMVCSYALNEHPDNTFCHGKAVFIYEAIQPIDERSRFKMEILDSPTYFDIFKFANECVKADYPTDHVFLEAISKAEGETGPVYGLHFGS